jgi:hypothetical protein
MDREAAFHQRLYHRAVRHFDGHGDRLRRRACRRQQPIAHRAEAFAAVRERMLAGHRTMGVHQNHLLNLGCPIDAGEPAYVVRRGSLLLGSLPSKARVTTTTADPCTGAHGANSPPGLHRGQPTRGTCPPKVLEAQGAKGGSRRVDP